jgi:flagellin-specific chaperone FliS
MWRKSLAVAETLKIPYEAGLSHYVLGKHNAAAKERQMHLQKAVEIFEGLGAVVDLEHAR